MRHTVLLVEDDARTRVWLERAVESCAGLLVVASVATCAEARARIAEQAPDVLLTDLGLPDGHGTELIREVSRAHPRTRSMVITVFGDEEHLLEAIRAGASGYLLKDATRKEIGRSILELLAGGSPISSAVARHLLKQLRSHEPGGSARSPTILDEELSPREREVLQRVADGSSYAEIAKQLFISVNTVGTHVKHIYDKLSVHSRGRAVREAEKRGLLRPPEGAH